MQLPPPKDFELAQIPHQSKMPQISRANHSGIDVTSVVQNLQSKGTITVSDDALGADLRSNVFKVLSVGHDDGTTRAAGVGQPLKLN